MGVVLAQMTTDFGGFALPSEAGFRAAMMLGCGVGLAAAIVAFLIPVRPVEAPSAAEETPEGLAPEASEASEASGVSGGSDASEIKA
jgi:hypothetical protein